MLSAIDGQTRSQHINVAGMTWCCMTISWGLESLERGAA